MDSRYNRVLIIGGGAYAYHVYSNVSNTLDAVHKPLDRDKSDKRSEKVDVSDKTYFNFNDGCRSTWRGSGRSDSLMLFTLNPTKIDENYKYST